MFVNGRYVYLCGVWDTAVFLNGYENVGHNVSSFLRSL